MTASVLDQGQSASSGSAGRPRLGRYAAFPREEYERRHQRVARLMEEHELDAVLLLQAEHLAYFTGYVDWMASKDPLACLLLKDRGPVLLLPEVQYPDAEAFTWVEDVRGWRRGDDYVDVWAAALRDLGLANQRVGAELGPGAHLAMPYTRFEALRAALPEPTLVDAMPVLWECRKIKSPLEVDYLRRSAAACDAAFAAAWDGLRPGISEREVAALMGAAFMREGADQIGSLVVRTNAELGSNNRMMVHKHPSDRRLQPGDFVTGDIACVYRGYWSDMQRTACIGPPSRELTERHAAAVVVNTAVRAAVRPGIRIAELDKVRAAVMAEHGLQAAFPAVGHGLGITIVEPPRIAGDVDEPLLPRMVFTVEPGVSYPPTFFACEDVVVVTEEGGESLTTYPRELFVAG